MGFRVLEHTADVGIESWGDDLREAFADAARGMFSLMVDIDAVAERLDRAQSVVAGDREGLLVSWLNELIGLVDAEGLVFSRFVIDRLTESALEARAFGEPLDVSRHQPHLAIKAATYHGLTVDPGPPSQIRVILDI